MVGTNERTAYTEDALKWLKLCFSKFENKPDDMEQITRFQAPHLSMKYKESAARGRGFYVYIHIRLGGHPLLYNEMINLSLTTTHRILC